MKKAIIIERRIRKRIMIETESENDENYNIRMLFPKARIISDKYVIMER